MQHAALKAECVAGARSEPLVEVGRAVLICTAIRPFPQRHVLRAFAPMTIAFVDDMQFFPKAQTLICKHLHKAVEPPVIIHQSGCGSAACAFLWGSRPCAVRLQQQSSGSGVSEALVIRLRDVSW